MILKMSGAIREHSLPDPTSPHETSLNAILRPMVFGANDGLVSNLALVMGVAGARPDPSVIVLAGVAGLIAGEVREEVGLDARSIGSPVHAALGSFVAFVAGAFVPLLPYLLTSGSVAFTASLALSLMALALLGVGISVLTRRSALFSAVRQVALGGIAAAVTFAVGRFIGGQMS